MNQLKRIALLTTGPTIPAPAPDHAATANDATAQDGQALLAAVPELQTLAQIECHSPFQIDRSNICCSQHVAIVSHTNQLLARTDIDGVVITHGTDTLEETALLLHLCIKSTKPVVVVGAMRPGSALSADGPMNLYQAVRVATDGDAHHLGVMVGAHDRNYSARYVRKMHTHRADAFDAPDTGPLGDMSNGVLYIGSTPPRHHTTHSQFSLAADTQLPAVDIIYDHPSANLAFYEHSARSQRAGLIIAGKRTEE